MALIVDWGGVPGCCDIYWFCQEWRRLRKRYWSLHVNYDLLCYIFKFGSTQYVIEHTKQYALSPHKISVAKLNGYNIFLKNLSYWNIYQTCVCLEIVCTVHYYRFYFYLTNNCTIFDVDFFFSLLHSYKFRWVSVITRQSLCILKLLKVLKQTRLLQTDVIVGSIFNLIVTSVYKSRFYLNIPSNISIQRDSLTMMLTHRNM